MCMILRYNFIIWLCIGLTWITILQSLQLSNCTRIFNHVLPSWAILENTDVFLIFLCFQSLCPFSKMPLLWLSHFAPPAESFCPSVWRGNKIKLHFSDGPRQSFCPSKIRRGILVKGQNDCQPLIWIRRDKKILSFHITFWDFWGSVGRKKNFLPRKIFMHHKHDL